MRVAGLDSVRPGERALSLADLTGTTISLLDTKGSKGFFLQVEGASIDKQDHSANACAGSRDRAHRERCAPLRVSYGTAAAGGSRQHTGSQLRIAACGPGSASVLGLTGQTDLFTTVTSALTLNLDTAALSAKLRVEGLKSTVAAGSSVSAVATGFAGDRQVRAIDASCTSPGAADVLDGRASFSLTMPTTTGRQAVTFTGVQSGEQVSTQVTVR